jgi:glycosyltransferase involved in cell wall biosynthesis
MACGRPVIAFGEGGALETIADGQTGVFFPEQTAASLKEAVEKAERISWDSAAIRRHAETFGLERYRRELKDFLIRSAPKRLDLSRHIS